MSVVAVYRIHRLKDHVRQQFRWAPHTIGLTTVKPKDYEPAGSVEADSQYAAWTALKQTDEALQPGDVLESECGDLRIYKYVGFEEAQWQIVEAKPLPDSSTSQAAPSATT
jgi:hypothetical protein